MDKSRRVKRTHAGSTPTSGWLRDCWLAVFNLSTLTLLVYFSSPSPTSLSVTSLSLSPCAMIFFPRARHALGSVGLHLLLTLYGSVGVRRDQRDYVRSRRRRRRRRCCRCWMKKLKQACGKTRLDLSWLLYSQHFGREEVEDTLPHAHTPTSSYVVSSTLLCCCPKITISIASAYFSILFFPPSSLFFEQGLLLSPNTNSFSQVFLTRFLSLSLSLSFKWVWRASASSCHFGGFFFLPRRTSVDRRLCERILVQQQRFFSLSPIISASACLVWWFPAILCLLFPFFFFFFHFLFLCSPS